VVLGTLRDRRLGRILGWLVVALAFRFIGARLWQGGAWDLVRPRLEPLLLAATGGALIYGLAGFLLSAAWREILAGEHPPGPAAAYHAVYGRTRSPSTCRAIAFTSSAGRSSGARSVTPRAPSSPERAACSGSSRYRSLPLRPPRPAR
jgi:hypothetical protein